MAPASTTRRCRWRQSTSGEAAPQRCSAGGAGARQLCRCMPRCPALAPKRRLLVQAPRVHAPPPPLPSPSPPPTHPPAPARAGRSGADKVSIGSDAVLAVEEYLARGGVKDGSTAIEQISRVYGAQVGGRGAPAAIPLGCRPGRAGFACMQPRRFPPCLSRQWLRQPLALGQQPRQPWAGPAARRAGPSPPPPPPRPPPQAVVISIDPKRVYVASPQDTTHFTVKTSKPGEGWEAWHVLRGGVGKECGAQGWGGGMRLGGHGCTPKGDGLYSGARPCMALHCMAGAQQAAVPAPRGAVPACVPTHPLLPSCAAGPNGEQYCWWQCTVKGGREGRDVDAVQLAKVGCAAPGPPVQLPCAPPQPLPLLAPSFRPPRLAQCMSANNGPPPPTPPHLRRLRTLAPERSCSTASTTTA